MADPPGDAPESHPTNTQETANPFSLENNKTLSRPARLNPKFTDSGDYNHSGRATTKEIRQLINNLKKSSPKQRSSNPPKRISENGIAASAANVSVTLRGQGKKFRDTGTALANMSADTVCLE
ncbi:hypothetical protein BBP40_007806 [Aspergillus hancockii]|nr:hypothetical protein BBP40_007806 [Aspergillus hancockii]